jgi:hypothetical protein
MGPAPTFGTETVLLAALLGVNLGLVIVSLPREQARTHDRTEELSRRAGSRSLTYLRRKDTFDVGSLARRHAVALKHVVEVAPYVAASLFGPFDTLVNTNIQ